MLLNVVSDYDNYKCNIVRRDCRTLGHQGGPYMDDFLISKLPPLYCVDYLKYIWVKTWVPTNL